MPYADQVRDVVDEGILKDNADSLQALEDLLPRLTDAGLARDLGEGWTLAVSLAHMAFWDRRAAAVLERWAAAGTPYHDMDDDIINLALLDEWLALPPRSTVELALSAARAANPVIERTPEHIWQALAGTHDMFLLHRALHRREHIEQIESAVSQAFV